MATGTTQLDIIIRASAAQARNEIRSFVAQMRREIASLGGTNARGGSLVTNFSQIGAQIQQLQNQAVKGQQEIAQAAKQGQDTMIANASKLEKAYLAANKELATQRAMLKDLRKEQPYAFPNILDLQKGVVSSAEKAKVAALRLRTAGVREVEGPEGVINLSKAIHSYVGTENAMAPAIAKTIEKLNEKTVAMAKLQKQTEQLQGMEVANAVARQKEVDTRKAILEKRDFEEWKKDQAERIRIEKLTQDQQYKIFKQGQDEQAKLHAQRGEILMKQYIEAPESKAVAAQYAYRQKNEVAYLKLKTEWLEKIKALEAQGYKDISIGAKGFGSWFTGKHGPDIETSPGKLQFAKDSGLIQELQQAEGATKVLLHQQSTLKAFAAQTANMMRSQISWFTGAGTIFAVAGGIAAASKATLEFYQNLKNIQAVTGESDAGIRKISAAAIEVAKNTPIAASEASKLGLTLIQAGLNSEQAAEAMKTVSAIVTVSGEDMTTVSKAVTTAMFAWHKSAKDIPDIGNSIAAALNFSRLTVTDLGTAFNYLASTSSIMGRSLNETVSIMATLSNAGIRASTIGTGISQLFTQLIVPSRNFQAELHKMGISANAVNPQMNKFADIVELLQSKGFSAAKAMHLLGDRAGRQMAAAMVMGADSFREMEKRIENSKQLQEGLAKAMEGPINATKNLRNQIEVAAIQIGAVGVPAFNAIISTIKVFSSVLVAATSGFSFLADTIGGGLTVALTAGAIASIALYRHFAMLAASAITTSGAVNFLSVSLAALAKNPYVMAITATITGLMLLGTLFGKNKDQVNGLATAYDASKAADEAKKRRIAEQAEEVKHLETTYTHLKEVWEEAGKKSATLPFQMENVGILGMYSTKVNDLADSVKKLDEVLQNIDKNSAGVGWFTRIIGGYQQVLDIQKKGVEGDRASKAAELLKAQKEEMEALAKANTEILSLSTGKYIDSVIAGIRTSKKATIDEQITEARAKWSEELQRIKNDISNIQYSIATTKSEPEKEKLRGLNKEKIQEMARTNESFKRLINELDTPGDKGMSKLADQTERYRNALLDAVRDTERLRQEIEDIQERDPYIKIHTQAQKAIDDLQNKLDEIRSTEAKTQEQGYLLGGQTFQLWQQIYALREKEEIQIQKLQEDGFIRLLQWSKEWDEKLRAIREAEFKRQLFVIDLSEKQQGISPLSATTGRMSIYESMLKSQEVDLENIDKLSDPKGWYAQQDAIDATRMKLVELQQTYREWTGTGMAGFKYGLQEYMWNPSYTMFNQMRGLATETANAMSQSFETFFFDAFEGRLKSFQDYFLSFLKAIQQALTKVLAQQVAMGMVSGVMGLFSSPAPQSTPVYTPPSSGLSLGGGRPYHHGGLIMHSGGLVPRFHSGGLASDEVPAVLQRGEYVVSRRGVQALDRMNQGQTGGAPVNVVINLENNSSQPVSAKTGDMKFDGRQYIIGVVLDDIERGGPLRNAMAGAR